MTRRVRVTFDESGDPVRYYDFRGDTDVGEPHDDRTLLQIEFDTGIVSVLDRKDGASRVARFDLEAALEAESLGSPRRMIELIRSRCG